MKGKPKDDETGAAGATSEAGTTGEEAQGESKAPERSAIDYAAEIASRDASLAERDGRIAELEAQIAEAGKIGEENASLKAEVEQLKNSAASERIDFALQLAGCRNVKAARAVLDDYNGDVEALKAAESWMFNTEKAPEKQKGSTGLPNAGAADDSEKLQKRMRRAAGLPEKKV